MDGRQMIFRFLFFNRHVGVLYSCLSISDDGRCDERAIYVISRHETIDHAELIVLEKVAKAVCVDPQVLYHTATFGERYIKLRFLCFRGFLP
ncbi:hypothetical protein ANCDUO_23260 [Ancylostoma duodenale]|uniref:Uncharacterized protein n=1 Tax=Ancylostoma duodenale TaxID=51022 RepID=A0A0C2FPA5_9BILA|nr:hypothetical protein ANCDUO_23260 [Ancylostoma duodenale]